MRMTGGDAIAATLIAHGVDTIFGLPGVQVYDLFDAFGRAELRVVGARHEQGCSYMALGYALSTGRPGVCAIVPGPGLLNAAAGIVTGLGRAPLLCLTGEVPSKFLGIGRGHLHELPDQLATLRLLTKWAAHIDEPGDAPGLVAEAFRQMMSGRQGPVALQMCWDKFGASAEMSAAAPLPPLPNPALDTAQIEPAVAAMRTATAPLIMVGGGALGAEDEIRALSERLGAPVMSFRSGRGLVNEDSKLGVTVASAYRLWPETDLLIGIGSRLEVPGWRWPARKDAPKTVRIDIDPIEFERRPAEYPILADAAEAIRGLLDALGNGPAANRYDAIATAKAEIARDIQKIQPQIGYLEAIRTALPDDGFLVDELSQVGFASWYGFPVRRPRSFISSGYQGTLGAGFPMALGVKVAHPDKPVVSIAGDGGFMFAVQELATAVQYGIGVVVVVFNNSAFGNVRRDQTNLFAGRIVGADLVNPDFVALARAFGVEAARVDTPAALRRALDHAFAAGGPWLIEVPVPRGSETSPWEFIRPAPPA